MADTGKIADDFECRRHQVDLVDLAEGVLIGAVKARVDEHLKICSSCTAALAALRELPPVMQKAVPVPDDEAFWSRQRDDIMGRIRQQPVTGRARRAVLFWGAGCAAAAVLVLTVLGYQTLLEHELPLNHASVSLEQLDQESRAELNDLMDLYVSENRLMPMDVVSDHDPGPGGIPIQKEQTTDRELREFSEEDLERLYYIVGELG